MALHGCLWNEYLDPQYRVNLSESSYLESFLNPDSQFVILEFGVSGSCLAIEPLR